eukprot:scaffold85134_cov51-Attheya_sp.AAC.2
MPSSLDDRNVCKGSEEKKERTHLDHASVLANHFVPERFRSYTAALPTAIFPTASCPTFDGAYGHIRSALLPSILLVRNGVPLPVPVRVLNSDLYYSISQLQKPHFRTALPPVDNTSDIRTYRATFEILLREERKEVLLLYERYSLYNRKLEYGAHLRKTWEERFWTTIDGIADAKPSVQVGDFLLMRPVNYVKFPRNWQNPYQNHATSESLPHLVEIQSQITTVMRSPNGKDRVQAFWIFKPLNKLLKKNYNLEKGRFHLRIVPNPKSLVRCLTALDWLSTLQPDFAMELLFPTKAPIIPASSTKYEETDEIKQLNRMQACFVRMALQRTDHSEYKQVRAPIVLTGPAGTGKTNTLICTIREIMNRSNKDGRRIRVLVCAPSHTASDVITRRLSQHLSPHQLFRLFDSDRPVQTVPAAILPFCEQSGETGTFLLPTAAKLLQFEVIVCTCIDAHILFMAGLTNQQLRIARSQFRQNLQQSCAGFNLAVECHGALEPHFTHLFIDEAAQATEPESLIPLSVVIDPEPDSRKVEIALAGDPRQLSPQVFSSSAAKSGLGRSWMERMLQRPVSCLGGGHEHMLGPEIVRMDDWVRYSFHRDGQEQLSAFLTLSYRGHPSILAMPSALFYGDKLQRADWDRPAEDTHQWNEKIRFLEALSTPVLYSSVDFPEEIVQQKQFNFPIHFRGVIGNDTSVSITSGFVNDWSNQKEAEEVVSIVEALLEHGVSSQSIGIMAPFRGQVVLIRRLLRKKLLGGINVGTIEDYQGVEFSVIVLSLTRSNKAFISHDIDCRMGVFGQPKRSNVSLTRADNAFVVVGNPEAMVEDEVWKQWLWFTLRNGLWYGERGNTESYFQWKTSMQLVRCHPLINTRRDESVGGGNEEGITEVVAVGSLERALRSSSDE